MSHPYRMHITIEGHHREHELAIKNAAEARWPFHEWWSSMHRAEISAEGDGVLSNTMPAQDYADELAVGVWQANGGDFCMIEVAATRWEKAPCDSGTQTCILDEYDFARLMKAATV